MARSVPQPQTGSRYQHVRRLAIGGMGEIFLARQLGSAGFTRLVVVKRLLPELAEQPELLALFVDEARIAAQLTHPGIVQVFEFGHDREGYFLSMEYIPGQNLGRVMQRAVRQQAVVPWSVAAYVGLHVARALDHAHNARDAEGRPLHLVHRDVSPSNVLVSYAGDVKLMDFGIAKAANKSHRTRTGVVRGKFAYMSPEQAAGEEVDARSDLFSLGVVLWELALGRRLFAGESDVEALRSVMGAPIPSPSSIDPHFPRRLEQVIMGCLERDLARRTPSAAAVAQACKAAFSELAPADHGDLAALIKQLFPGEAAETEQLVKEATRASSQPAIAERRPDDAEGHATVASPRASEQPATVPMGAQVAPAPVVTPRARRAPLVMLLLVLLAGGGFAGWYFLLRRPEPVAVAPPVPVSDAAPPLDGAPPPDAAPSIPDAGSSDARVLVIAEPDKVPHPRNPRGPKNGGQGSQVAVKPAEPPPSSATGKVSVDASGGYLWIEAGAGKCTRATTPTICTLPEGKQVLRVRKAKDGPATTLSVTVSGGKTGLCQLDALADRPRCQ